MSKPVEKQPAAVVGYMPADTPPLGAVLPGGAGHGV